MPQAHNVIAFNRKSATKKKLINAVGSVLAREGFRGLGINNVAREAGVDKVLVYRYFGGLPELVAAYSETVDFWPSAEELLGPDPETLKAMPADQQMAVFVKRFIASLRRRPVTQDILAWEMVERNELTMRLEQRRIRTALEFFEQLENLPEDLDLTVIVLLITAAVNFLIVKSRMYNSVGGIDLVSDAGWHRIEKGIDLLLQSAFNPTVQK